MSALAITRSLAASRSIGVSEQIDLYVLFDTDKDQPNAAGLEQAKALSQALASRAAKVKRILIVGHTDVRGTDAYNENLSRRRAEQVSRLLAQWQPELAAKLKPKGKGERQPRYSGTSDEDHRLNRRVEVRLQQ